MDVPPLKPGKAKWPVVKPFPVGLASAGLHPAPLLAYQPCELSGWLSPAIETGLTAMTFTSGLLSGSLKLEGTKA